MCLLEGVKRGLGGGDICHCDEDRWWGCIAVNEWVSPPFRQTQGCGRQGGRGGRRRETGKCMGTVPGAEIWNGCFLTASSSAQCRKRKKISKTESHAVFQYLTHIWNNLYHYSFTVNRSVIDLGITKWCIYQTCRASQSTAVQGSVIYAQTKALLSSFSSSRVCYLAFWSQSQGREILYHVILSEPSQKESH